MPILASRSLTSTLASIAANVRTQRQEKDLTQEDLAEKAGVELRNVQRIERGSTNLSVVVLIGIALALDVEPGALLKKVKAEPSKRGGSSRRA
jgi:transcriptional regulator with XRE-family HTH domain